MRPSMLTRKPLPWTIGLPSLSDMTIDTTAPFAALAIAGMSFRGGTSCAAATLATIKNRENSFRLKRPIILAPLLINAFHTARRIAVLPDDLLVLIIVDSVFPGSVVVAISRFDDQIALGL